MDDRIKNKTIQDINTIHGISRRDFLKKSGQAALAVGGGLSLDSLLTGCATTSFKEESPIIYPPLKGHKVQPPEDGCLVGFYSPYAVMLPGYKRSKDTGSVIDRYEKHLGQKPSILTLFEGIRIWSDFPMEEAVGAADRGVIPLIYAEVGITKLEDIANGKLDNSIKKFADGAIKFGEKYGGFFITTMREMNGNWFPWGQQPRAAKEAWKQIWQNFEDRKANVYATWVWEVYSLQSGAGDYPEKYYPGDEYVDWIGLSAYSRSIFPSGRMSFGSNYLTGSVYHDMRRSHPDKPVMMAEFGKTRGSNQARWLEKAFETIKYWPGMKAAIYWDNLNWELGDDHTLNKESMELLKEIIKGEYFIGAK